MFNVLLQQQDKWPGKSARTSVRTFYDETQETGRNGDWRFVDSRGLASEICPADFNLSGRFQFVVEKSRK